MTQTSIHVALPGREYDIAIGSGLLRNAGGPLDGIVKGRSCLILTDSHVGPLYAGALTARLSQAGAPRVHTLTFPAGEGSKTLQTVSGFYGECVRCGLDRRSLIVALGGGVVGDMAGFLAGTYMRGLDFIQVPTTLLSQVDSSVGGKTGVDLPEGKNLVGVFKQPVHVMIDTDTLSSLPLRELRSGLAEVVKYGVIFEEEFFRYLEQHVEGLLHLDREVYAHVIQRSCELKARVVVADEQDLTGVRAVLNYGHTFGHALEQQAKYSGLTHGEGVAIGMMMAAELAATRNPALRVVADRQQALWDALGLPTRARGFIPRDVLVGMRTDKKYEGGRTRLILPTRLGECRLVKDVPESEVLAAIGVRCDA